MISKIVWNPLFRFLLFWTIAGAFVYSADHYLDAFSLTKLVAVGRSGMEGGVDDAAKLIEDPRVVSSLAFAIGVAGTALLLAFLIMHVFLVKMSMGSARRILNRRAGELGFASTYEERIKPRLLRHPLVGSAWKEFDDTLLKDRVDQGEPIENTIRPQAFINVAMIREKLPGLKVISSISGYFVGTGLLLTFVGIVLALHKAATAAGSSDAAVMQSAVQELLQVASFKFWTSIAGLATSIVFALASRWFVIWIESALTRFCEDAEHQLKYSSPNSIAAKAFEVGKDQRDQLKEINSDRYFSRLADSVGPLIEQAMERAFSPVGTQIGTAIEQLKATSQSGLADMTKDFTAALQNGAGTEMRGVQDALREIQVSLVKTHEGMRGGGEDFSRRLSEAAENLNRLVSEAGTRLEGSAEQSRAGLADVVAAFKQTMDAANARIEAELGNAASSASSKVEAAMGRVMDGLEGQVRNLMQGLTEFQSSSAADAKQTSDRLREAQEGMASSVTSASADAVNALQSGVANAFERISSEIDRFQAAMSRGESALSHQAIAITEASTQTRIVADAFSDTAQQIRSTSAPLLESADKMARATTELNASVGKTLSTMDASNQSAGLLAQSLTEQVAGLRQLWEGYRAQFDRVDQDLAKAVQVLGDATAAQADKLYSFTKQTDEGLGKAVSTLATIVSEIKENTSDLSDTIEQLAKSGRHIAAQ
ncbi:MAG: hypothetical protein E5V92_18055 [Mesorhizobium sp.]|nr:MAG: hypothetical protein EOS75_23375 [Mesorhizobium sp.]TJW83542.1 MAG: hypothetical protein E5V92_18055 [Mesorhizobium sp.]